MRATPCETIGGYLEAFESGDAQAVSDYYHLPSLFIAPFGVTLVDDRGAAVRLASALIESAQSQGVVRSELQGLTERELADNLVSLTGTFVRFDRAGSELARFGFAYTLLRLETSWSIVTAIAHPTR